MRRFLTLNAERRTLNVEGLRQKVGPDRSNGLKGFHQITPGFRASCLNLPLNGAFGDCALEVQLSAFSVQRWRFL